MIASKGAPVLKKQGFQTFSVAFFAPAPEKSREKCPQAGLLPQQFARATRNEGREKRSIRPNGLGNTGRREPLPAGPNTKLPVYGKEQT